MLELRNLRHMLALARRLNYARAAEDLGITQPSLTWSIQALERQWAAFPGAALQLGRIATARRDAGACPWFDPM
jgi:hypothetical protein